MIKFIILLGLCNYVQSYENRILVSKRVRDGDVTPAGKFTGMVSLLTDNPEFEGFCTGSVLDEYTILSAAHCFLEFLSNNTIYYSPYNITTGSDFSFYQNDPQAVNLNPDDVVVYINPEYIQHTVLGDFIECKAQKHDVAILKTKVAFKFTKSFKPISASFDLPFIDQKNKLYRVMGFGHTTEKGKNNQAHKNNLKKKLNWSLISNQIIHLKDGGLNVETNDTVCALQGDSGGALLEESNNQYLMIGIVQGEQTGDVPRLKHPLGQVFGVTYFAPLYDNRDFIMSHMGKREYYCGDADVKKMGDEASMKPLYQYPSHHVWLLALFDTNNKYLCPATYIGNDTIVTYAQCLSQGGKSITINKIASIVEMAYWHKIQPGRPQNMFYLLNQNQQGGNYVVVFIENGIIGISIEFPISKLFYTRRVCSHQVEKHGLLNKKTLLSVSLYKNTSNDQVYVQETSQVFKRYEDDNKTVCTKFDHLNNGNNAKHYGDPLFSIYKGQYYLEGVLATKRNSENCFRILSDNTRLPENSQ